MLILIAIAALAGTCGYSWIRGGRPERLMATVIAAATIASVPSPSFWNGVEYGIMVIDTAVFICAFWIATKSDRFWPIWAAGFQLASVMTHIAVWIAPDIVPAAYANLSILWGYLVMGVLVVGVHFEVVRRRRRPSDWEQRFALEPKPFPFQKWQAREPSKSGPRSSTGRPPF